MVGMAAAHPEPHEHQEPVAPDSFAATYEDWRLLQEVLEERDREWWAENSDDTDRHDDE